MSNKNEVFEYLIDALRHQVNNSPYKQQCEDLAHEVQSLKNQLRDASAQIKELHLELVRATGDAEAYKLIREQEQSGCRKEDTQGCSHPEGQVKDLEKRLAKSAGDVYMYFGATEQYGCNGDDAQPPVPTGWVEWRGGACPVPDTTAVDVMFRDSQIIEHITPSSVLWGHHGALHGREIIAYRAPSNCEHMFVPDEYGLDSICLRCGAKECEHDWRVVQYSAGVETDKCRLCGVEKEVRYK